ncbi:hypothetical protein [Nocardia nova]|uniref:Transposase n=1 Tax=Nocardia nova TaxID=37330 RepID=A0A2S6A280_9NOCA|nr:hypothetical protein [Nocardia nova]PPJ25646.1 hypothetical protein C5F51_22740 [Nocardia nova]
MNLPSEIQVRQAFTKLIEQARTTGHRPSVLALARQFELSNTTFRRHYPEIVTELGVVRRTPTTKNADSPAADEHERLVARNAKLRRDNRRLREHLDIAAANLARLSIDNQRLQQQLEHARGVTSITSRTQTD